MDNPLADLDQVKAIPDPAERARQLGRVLKGIGDANAEVSALRRAAVLELKAARGLSLSELGAELGLHRGRVQNIIGKPEVSA